MIIDNELRAKIAVYLPADYVKQCAEDTGYSKSMIHKVMHEEADNTTISEWLIHTALKIKNHQSELLQISKQL
jgi:hypothetical protein